MSKNYFYKKNFKRFLFFLFFIFFFNNFSWPAPSNLTIIHSNDLHSHLRPSFSLEKRKSIGGFARIASIVKKIKQERSNPVIVLDAGDFMMGSLFHTISREKGLELTLMGKIGYDAVAIGNHEFDFKPVGLAKIITSGTNIPKIIASNLVFSQKSSLDDDLEKLFLKKVILPYYILQKNDLKIGVFSLIGKKASEVMPFASPVKISDPIKAASDLVRKLKEKKVDLIICLSHSGLHEDRSKSEDEILAQKVSGIDLIISGHSHTKIVKPLLVNKTIIVQAGEYGQYLGLLDLNLEEHKTKILNYELKPIDDKIKENVKIKSLITSYQKLIDENFLKKYDLRFTDPVAKTDFDLFPSQGESNLGNLIADSIRWSINFFEAKNSYAGPKVRIALESNGLIRGNFLKGKVSVAEIFKVFPLGIGLDDSVGYPLASVYLYPFEIKRILEIVTSVAPLKGKDYFLHFSGLKFEYNPKRVIFDRVTKIWLEDDSLGYQALDYSKSNKTLYRLAANIYNASFLKVIGDYTWHFLEINPKDEKGHPLNVLAEALVDINKRTPGTQELKEWLGLTEYLKSFQKEGEDNLPLLPKKYQESLKRIIAKPSYHPYKLLKNGSLITWIFCGLGILGFFLFLLGSFWLIKKLIFKFVGNRNATS